MLKMHILTVPKRLTKMQFEIFNTRVMEHLRYIKKGINTLGEHYKNSTCDSNRDLKFQVIEKVFPNEDPMRLHREKFWIDRLDVMEPNGLNRRA